MMTPTPDVPSDRERARMRLRERSHETLVERFARRFPTLRGRRRGRRTPGDEGVPVEPNRPNHLTGGAAAALDFEHD